MCCSKVRVHMASSNRSVFLDSTGRRRRWLSWTTIVGATVATIAAAGFFSALLLSHPSAPTLPLAAVMRAVPQVKTPATDAGRLALQVSDREQELARETRAAKPKARVADPSGKRLSYDQHEEGSHPGRLPVRIGSRLSSTSAWPHWIPPRP